MSVLIQWRCTTRCLLVATVLCGAISAWANPAEQTADEPAAVVDAEEDYYELFELFVDSMDQIERNYVKPVDRRELVEAAIEGMLEKLDPYSSYVPPEELAGFRTNVESTFGGIGLQVDVREGKLTVVSPLVGSPAYRAGIIAGDIITELDGKSTIDLTLQEADKKLKGQVGTEISVTVRHPHEEAPKTYGVRREIVRVDTVLGDRRMLDDSWNFLYDDSEKIGYVRITAFGRETSKELRAALEQLREQQIRGLILDLRFNPGGLLTSAIEVSDMFLSQGRIVSTTGRNAVERTWDAHRKETFPNLPIVVLVNRYSASASEIVAAALQDNGRALIVGERTWGKGSVQNVIELEGGKSILKLTTAGYLRPNGHNIHRFADAEDADEWGVIPNEGYHIRLTPVEMSQLLRDRRHRDIVTPHKPAQESDTTPDEKAEPNGGVTAPAIEAKFVDRQLRKAIAYLNVELAKAE